ncbi:hypothetical protein ACFXP3_24380 [Streptomyces sp. NPDC059096]|uniref:hypothetical protein n=1 Tax=Streptomyces sp. NPDC059096 TaxID=3346727 RepID=UPI0036BF6940
MLQSLPGRDDLLLVAVQVVPAGGGDDGEDRGVEEHREEGSVAGYGLGAQGSYGAAQGAGVVVFGVDAGAGGAFEGSGRLPELGPDVLGREAGEGVEGFAEGGEVGLGCGVVMVVEVVGDAFRGCGGLVPGIRPASATEVLVGGFDGGQAFVDLGVREVRCELGAGEPDGFAGGVGVVGERDLVAADVAGGEALEPIPLQVRGGTWQSGVTRPARRASRLISARISQICEGKGI